MPTAADALVTWLIKAGLDGISQADLLTGYCERLVAAGVPLWRASMGAATLHPLIDAHGHRWFAGQGVQEEFFPRDATPERLELWRQSPWYWMLEADQLTMRMRLATGEGTNRFPMLAELAAAGSTDYWACILGFGDQAQLGETMGVATSWTSAAPGGFSESQLALIEATLPAFALAFKAAIAIATAGTLVTTYLGEDAARRVLRGEIERGRVTNVRRVLWFSDLVGFTRLADALPQEQLLALLNAYADCLVGVVHAHGGQVLKFMGDGVLAVVDGTPAEACGQALAAAQAARGAIERLNRSRAAAGLPVTDFTLALHEGEVLYGNIGSQDRLDFTVVGPAVNEVSRIQALCRSLDQPLLISASFAGTCGELRQQLVSVGRYALRGVERPQELFTLAPESWPAPAD